jgi:hypothetical protein
LQKAIDDWVDAIRAEEALAMFDHSMIALQKWDAAQGRASLRQLSLLRCEHESFSTRDVAARRAPRHR